MRRIITTGVVALAVAGCGGGGTTVTPAAGSASPSAASSSAAAPSSAAPSTSAPETSYSPPSYTPSAEATSPLKSAVGSALTITQDGRDAGELTLVKVEQSKRPRSEFGEPPSNDRFVYATILFDARRSLEISPLDFAFLADDGTRYEYSDGNALSAPADVMESRTVSAGQKARGVLAFDVPVGKGEIVYAPSYTGETLTSWPVVVK